MFIYEFSYTFYECLIENVYSTFCFNAIFRYSFVNEIGIISSTTLPTIYFIKAHINIFYFHRFCVSDFSLY